MSYEIPSRILEILDEVVREANSRRHEPHLLSREDVLIRALTICKENDAGDTVIIPSDEQIHPNAFDRRFEGKN